MPWRAARAVAQAHSKFRGRSPHELVFGRLPPCQLVQKMDMAGVDVDAIHAEEDHKVKMVMLREGLQTARVEQRYLNSLFNKYDDDFYSGEGPVLCETTEQMVNLTEQGLAQQAAELELEVEALETDIRARQARRAEQWKEMAHVENKEVQLLDLVLVWVSSLFCSPRK